MTIRPYQPTDHEPLLAVFHKSVPHAFAPEEATDFAHFLRTNTDPYFIAELAGRVVGGCGHYLTADTATARIGWILSDPDYAGSGIGGTLLRHNLGLIARHAGIHVVECRTSQVAYRFFNKFGFQLQYTQADFWAPGFDLYFVSRPNDSTAHP